MQSKPWKKLVAAQEQAGKEILHILNTRKKGPPVSENWALLRETICQSWKTMGRSPEDAPENYRFPHLNPQLCPEQLLWEPDAKMLLKNCKRY